MIANSSSISSVMPLAISGHLPSIERRKRLLAGLLPAVYFEHGVVRARRGVEGELLAHRRLGALDLLFVLAGDDERAADDVDVGRLAAGLLRARLDRRHDDFLRVLGRVEAVQRMPSQSSPARRHVRVHGGDVDRHVARPRSAPGLKNGEISVNW